MNLASLLTLTVFFRSFSFDYLPHFLLLTTHSRLWTVEGPCLVRLEPPISRQASIVMQYLYVRLLNSRHTTTRL